MLPVCVVIPAYNPSNVLIELVDSLLIDQYRAIVIVNDGSDCSCNPIFSALSSRPVTILTHLENRGKGAALKTAFQYVLNHEGHDNVGVVTADADGQHRAQDILKIANALVANPLAVHLGARKFNHHTPLRSFIGNSVTRMLYKCIVHQSLSDTQTGLRGLPGSVLPMLVNIDNNGYEFELQALLMCKQKQIGVIEHAITTLYFNNNRGSHFNPLRDSAKIYWVLIRYTLNSLSSFIVDFLLFSIVFYITSSLLGSLIIARFFSGLYNFLINRNMVFKSQEGLMSAAWQYAMLAGICVTLSYLLISQFFLIGLNVYVSKVVADVVVYVLSFSVQRWVIFRWKSKASKV